MSGLKNFRSLNPVKGIHFRKPSDHVNLIKNSYRFPRVFGDEFGDKFGETFSDSLNLVSNVVTNLVMNLVNRHI